MNYYSGGLAELVYRPSRLTMTLFNDWFCGNGSFGLAMELLGLPYETNIKPIVALNPDGVMLVDLIEEENTLYKKTIFRYKQRSDESQEPKLEIGWGKVLSPQCWMTTLKVMQAQVAWLVHSREWEEKARKWVDEIKVPPENLDWSEYMEILKTTIWPKVIAVGTLAEYYYRVQGKAKPEISAGDWFIRSLADQALVKNRTMSFDDYLVAYGHRADNDYELDCPRWKEIPKEIKKRIQESQPKAVVNNPILVLKVWQELRTECRKKCLAYFYELRKALIHKMGTVNIGDLTVEELISNDKKGVIKKFGVKKTLEADLKPLKFGQGRPISVGIVSGKVLQIRESNKSVPSGTVGIFPNASTQFTQVYSKCEGIIFLAGGMTSHGAIVAREFGIPAIIDMKAAGLVDGEKIEINAKTGKWKVLT